MHRVFNFSAGPATLADEVLKKAQLELINWNETNLSMMEVSHRGPEFKEVAAKAEADLRELMNIPYNYHVLFLSGGASSQFAMVPINLLGDKGFADYVDTGIWSKKAIKEAKRFADVNIVTSLALKDGKYLIPNSDEWSVKDDAAYLHYTPNETIEGIEFNFVPQSKDVPLVADMSSSILSQNINVADYGIIYAGAQKNISHAGVTIVIIRDDLVKPQNLQMPSMLSYELQVANNSFYNTPPVYAWYMAGLTFAWMKQQGGVDYFAKQNAIKAAKLYEVIDNSKDFYVNNVHESCRSKMNVTFYLQDATLTEKFWQEADANGLKNLRGHRTVGGIRASIYNAMPKEGVDKLCEFMQDFMREN